MQDTLPSIDKKADPAVRTLLGLIINGHSLVLTCSGGKDSLVTTVCGIEAIRRAKEMGVPQNTHYISSSDTMIENFALHNCLVEMHEEIRQFAKHNDLPLEVRMVQPSLPSQFVVNILGRGTLPRSPINSHKKESGPGGGRSCSVSWKKIPQEKLLREIRKRSINESGLDPVVVFGTRFSESAIRKKNMEDRGERDKTPFTANNGMLAISPIAKWSDDDVWSLLSEFMTSKPPWESLPQQRFYRVYKLYSGMAESQCGYQFDEDRFKAPCGSSRSGCSICLIVGSEDNSLSNMLREEEYQFMSGINKLRDYLVNTQFDMSKREVVGRTLSPAGYAPVRPDVYSVQMRRDLLRFILTLDAREIERAEEVDAALCRGEIPKTETNLRLAEPQFNLISPKQIVAIDFYWGIHRCSDESFYALKIWHDVHTFGRRYDIPKTELSPKIPIPKKRWFRVGRYDLEAPAVGLRDFDLEIWNPYLDPDRAPYRTVDGKRLVNFEEENELTVDPVRAGLFVTQYMENFADYQQFDGYKGSAFYLNSGIVKLPKGMIRKYQEMTRRAQYFDNLAFSKQLTNAELDEYLWDNSLSDEEHEELLRDMGYDDNGSTAKEEELTLF